MLFNALKNFSSKYSSKQFFHWGSLIQIASSPLTAIAVYGTILVPFVSAEIKILKHVKLLNIDPFKDLSVPISMLLSYGFSLSFALASILTLIWCPPLIKEHKNFSSYLADISNVSERVTQAKQTNDLDSITDEDLKSEAGVDRILKVIAESTADKTYKTMVDNFIDQAITDWRNLQEDNEAKRSGVGLLFLLSFILGFVVFFIIFPASIIF